MAKSPEQEAYEKQKLAWETAFGRLEKEGDRMWSRGLFFWTFIGAIFFAYTEVSKEGYEQKILACLGFIVSYLWILVARSSRNLQNAWLREVSLLEKEITGPLIGKTIRGDEGELPLFGAKAFAVSKIYIIIAYLITVVWFLLVVNDLFFKQYPSAQLIDEIYLSILLFIGSLIVLFISYVFAGDYPWKK